ncbi:MAG: PmoA family protein [Planctomycetota bacterium]
MRQCLFSVLCFFVAVQASANPDEKKTRPSVSITEIEGKFEIKANDKPFATLHTKGFAKPIVYPIYGPGGETMIRHHPMKKGVKGERADHPHHQSLWFTHGAVNGVSFWHVGDNTGTIVCTKAKHTGSASHKGGGISVSVKLNNEWKKSDGSIVCTDEQDISFFSLPNGDRAIDYSVTVMATHGDVTFGDTKEGTAGIRTNPQLRIDRGAVARNSEGVKGKGIWGKRAKWVDYSAKVEGSPVGVSIFDHPKNLRHPTWWHARDYGLVAANPFGIHNFERKERGTGDFVIKKGGKLTFRYRYLFHKGNADEAKVEAQWKAWAGGK